MSHNFQGYSMPSNQPKRPSGFGVPSPGAPSDPSACPYPQNSGYSPAPSFGMPQAYPHQPNFPQPAPTYTGYPGSSMPQPNFNTYPSSSMPQPDFNAYPSSSMPQPDFNACPAPSMPQPNFNAYPSFPSQPQHPSYNNSPHLQSNYQSPPYNPVHHQQSSFQSPPFHPPPHHQPSYPARNVNANSPAYPINQSVGGPEGGYSPSIKSISKPSHSAPRPKPRLIPTVVPYPDFDPRADAEVIRKAMKGFGTDEKAIIKVLANRSNLQRLDIETQFKTLYGKDIIKDLKSELSGNFEKLILAMMIPLPQYYAKELHDAMSGVGTDETALIEVMCTMSNHEIRVICQAYEAMYGKCLEDDLMDDTSGNFKRLMVSLCCGNRDESNEVDPAAAAEDARQLLQAGELRVGTDESTFNAVLASRSYAQLACIFNEYYNITGHNIDEAIKREFSGDIEKALIAIVKCVNNRFEFFAEQLHKSMKGAGTQDRRLIRLVVTRSEVDMGNIKEAYQQKYGKSLAEAIADDCSGDYKKCLLELIA